MADTKEVPENNIFVAVAFSKMTVYDQERRGAFRLVNKDGNQLILDMSFVLGAAFVATVQALFLSIECRLRAGRALRKRGEWVEIAARRPKTIHSDASATQDEVLLAIDENTRTELNYRLTLDDAERLQDELAKAIAECNAPPPLTKQ